MASMCVDMWVSVKERQTILSNNEVYPLLLKGMTQSQFQNLFYTDNYSTILTLFKLR